MGDRNVAVTQLQYLQVRCLIIFFFYCYVNFSSNILDSTRALTRRCSINTLYYIASICRLLCVGEQVAISFRYFPRTQFFIGYSKIAQVLSQN